MSSEGRQKDLKKKGRYVPSRYKQAAENISIQSNLPRERSVLHKNSRYKQGLQVSCNSSQDTSTSKSSISQDCQGMTSTPTSKGEMPLPPLDESVVTNTEGLLSIPHLKGRMGPLSTDLSVKRNLKKRNKFNEETMQLHVPVVVSHKDKKSVLYNEKIADAEMDILYAQYLQVAFLESEAKKVLVSRSECAMETLHKLWSLVSQYMIKVQSQNFSLKLISTIIMMHEHLQKQEGILKPVFEIIPSLAEKYKNLAKAVNVNKHKLHVKDVLLPEPGCEGEIFDGLKEMSDFINEFFEQVPNYKEIILTADALKNYVDAGELITEALKRGLNLLVEARDLYFSEASLALSSST